MNLINQLTMSSLEIAEVVESRHDNVKRTIETLTAKGLISFTQIEEKTNGRPAVVYFVNKRDSYVVVAQLCPEFTARLVDRWQELESQQAPALPKSFSEALQLAADQARQIEEQEKALALAAPKSDFYDAVTGSDDCIDMAAAAKTLAIKGMERTKLFKLLRDKKVLQKNNQPYQEQVDAGRFRVIETKWTDGNGDTHINLKTVVYQKDLDYIRELIEKDE